ncbi:MAG TPA: hypothetical protein DCG52_03560 [Alphaproteobacteria bacterium]|nr:hypothetical protein [Alphaproteobacteria bacterium]
MYHYRLHEAGGREKTEEKILKIVLVAVFVFYMSANAEAGTRLYSPNVEKGELEFEWIGDWDFDDTDSKDNNYGQRFLVGWGLTDYVKIEGGVRVKKTATDRDMHYDSWILELVWQLTEPGEHWVDAGLYFEYIDFMKNTDTSKQRKVETKILLEENQYFDNITNIANIVFEREFGDNSDKSWELAYSFGSKYRYSPYFEPGFEAHGNTGKVSHSKSLDNQKHYFGPVAYGAIPAGSPNKIAYKFGYLTGLTSAAIDNKFIWEIEYEIYF